MTSSKKTEKRAEVELEVQGVENDVLTIAEGAADAISRECP